MLKSRQKEKVESMMSTYQIAFGPVLHIKILGSYGNKFHTRGAKTQEDNNFHLLEKSRIFKVQFCTKASPVSGNQTKGSILH